MTLEFAFRKCTSLVVGSSNCSIYDDLVVVGYYISSALCFLLKVLEESESVAHDFSRQYRISSWNEFDIHCFEIYLCNVIL